MGQIYDDAVEVYRAYVTDGVPASGPNDPSKTDIIGLFQIVDSLVDGAISGVTSYATAAALPASTNSGKIYLVTSDPTAANNGYWQDQSTGNVILTALNAALKGTPGLMAAATQAQATAGTDNTVSITPALLTFLGLDGTLAGKIAQNAAAVDSLSQITVFGTSAPVSGVEGGAANTVFAFADAIADSETVYAFRVNAAATGTLKVYTATYNGATGAITPVSALVSITVPVTGLQDILIPGLTVTTGQIFGVIDPLGNIIPRTNGAAPVGVSGYYSGGSTTGAFTDTVKDTTYRLEAAFILKKQVVTAASVVAEQTTRASTDQLIDRQVRRLDYASRLEAGFGDSRIAQEVAVITGAGTVNNMRGIGPWASILSNKLVVSQPTLNLGVGGQNSTQFLARINDAIQSPAKIIRIGGFVNDAAQGVDSATVTQPNILSMVTQLRAAGKQVIIHDDYPPDQTVLTSFTNDDMTQHAATRDYIRSLHSPLHGIAVAYTWDLIATAANGTTPKANALADGLHPTPYGAFLAAPAVVTAWQALGLVDFRPMDSLAKNEAPNPTMTGTGGNLGTGCTGTVATNWTATATSTGGAITLSQPTSGGVTWQQVVMSGTWAASTPGVTLTSEMILADFNAGDVIDLYCDIQVDGPSSGLRSISMGVLSASGVNAGVDGQESPAQLFPTDAWSGRFGTRFTWPSGATRATVSFAINAQVTNPSVTVRIGNVRVQRVIP